LKKFTCFVGFIGRMKVTDLFGRSLPRNPLLFGLMQRMNLVEKIGSGLMRIRNAMQEYGLPDIELEADGNWFKIIFKRTRENINQEQEGNEGGMKGGTESGTKGGMNKIDISDRQQEVLDIIEEKLCLLFLNRMLKFWLIKTVCETSIPI
jgi:ATP-dependent DNA helicase RecG